MPSEASVCLAPTGRQILDPSPEASIHPEDFGPDRLRSRLHSTAKRGEAGTGSSHQF